MNRVAEEEHPREAAAENNRQVQGTVSVVCFSGWHRGCLGRGQDTGELGQIAKVSLARRVSSDLTPQCRQGMVPVSPQGADEQVPGQAQREGRSRRGALEMVCFVY